MVKKVVNVRGDVGNVTAFKEALGVEAELIKMSKYQTLPMFLKLEI